MDKLVIEGGHPLNGEARVRGAKNAALPIIAAALLTADECLLENVPRIQDVRIMLEVLEKCGISAQWEGAHSLLIRADQLRSCQIEQELASKFRASFLIAGPLLSRFGEAHAPHPGGCSIGTRPISVDLKGFRAMGAELHEVNGCHVLRAERLIGQRITLDYPSHTGTENLIMAACLAEGTTAIENASVEPEVSDLANCLNAMGARISGAGSGIIQIEGVKKLHGVVYHIMPDRLEAGTFALAGLITGGKVTLRERLTHYLGALTSKLQEMGATVTAERELYAVEPGKKLTAVDIRTFPYPGFPTDLQAPFAALATQAVGESQIQETMYDGRLAYATELRKMGAQVRVDGQTAFIQGPTELQGTAVSALDIRSGAAVVLAALAAHGATEVLNVHYIDRGYEQISDNLSSLGAVIKRVSEPVEPATDRL